MRLRGIIGGSVVSDYYWMGRPLSEIPREELERALVKVCEMLTDLQGVNLRRSTQHINDLVAVRKRYEG